MSRLTFFSLPPEIRGEVYALIAPEGGPYFLQAQDEEPLPHHRRVPEDLRPFDGMDTVDPLREAREYMMFKHVVVLRAISLPHGRSFFASIPDSTLVSLLSHIRRLELLMPLKAAEYRRKATINSIKSLFDVLPTVESFKISCQRHHNASSSHQHGRGRPTLFDAGFVKALDAFKSQINDHIIAAARQSLQIFRVRLSIQSRLSDNDVEIEVGDLVKYWDHRHDKAGLEQLQQWRQKCLDVSLTDDILRLVYREL